MIELEPAEKRIIRVLYAANKPLATMKIAKRADMAWQTAKKYLLKLHAEGIVIGQRYGNVVYWWLRT